MRRSWKRNSKGRSQTNGQEPFREFKRGFLPQGGLRHERRVGVHNLLDMLDPRYRGNDK